MLEKPRENHQVKRYVKHYEDESSWSDKSEDEVEATASELELGKGMFGMEFEVRAGMEKEAKSLRKEWRSSKWAIGPG